MDGWSWNTSFLLGNPILRGYVSLGEGTVPSFFFGGGFKSYFSMSQERIPSLAPQDTPAAVDQGTHFVELNN